MLRTTILIMSKIVTNPMAWFLALGLGAMSMVGSMDFEDALHQNDRYCQMVQLFKDSDGATGWPDYNENYEEVCPL